MPIFGHCSFFTRIPFQERGRPTAGPAVRACNFDISCNPSRDARADAASPRGVVAAIALPNTPLAAADMPAGPTAPAAAPAALAPTPAAAPAALAPTPAAVPAIRVRPVLPKRLISGANMPPPF